MAPNKFATTLHRKTNRITLVLVYVVLEWVLIFLLLLNSLFSYLIIRFAHYFGLKTPCLLCSRLDHILEPHNSTKSSYRELICEHHALELSRSGYCFNHQKLVESQDMCENCSFSHLHNRNKHPSAMSVFQWLKEVGMVKSDGDCLVAENDNDDVNLRCSCCGVTINSYILSPALMANRGELLYPSDCDEEPDQNEDQDTDRIMGLDSYLINEDDNSDGFSFWLPKRGYSMVDVDEEEELAVSKAEKKPVLTKGPYANERVLPEDVEFYIDLDDYQLVPVKMVNLETNKSENESQVDQKHGDENMVDMLPTIEAEETTREVKCQVVGDQTHDVQVIVNDDQVTEETELNELNVNLPTTDVGDGNHIENDEIEVEYLPTQKGQDMVELEATKMKEVLSNKSDEEEIKIDVQLGAYDVQVPEITELKALKDDIPTSENNKTKAHDDIPTKLCNKLEIMEVKTKELFNGKVHEEEKREVDDTEFIDTNKQFQVFGDQVHDVPITTFDDQVTEETEFDQVKSNIALSDVGDVFHGENDEIEDVNSPTKQGQDMELKREIVVEAELKEIRMKEFLINRGDEEETKINVHTPEETQVKEPNADVLTSENDGTMSENVLTKVGDDLEIMELDNTKTKELLNKKVHEEEKKEVDDTEFVDTNKQFHVAGDQSHDVPITSFDDQVTEETEFDQVKSNIASSDFEDLCNKDKGEIDTLRSLELKDKSQMVEPSSILLENGDFELIHQTEESHDHNYIKVEIREQELLYDPALPRKTNEERQFPQRMESDDQETMEKSVADALSALHAELEEERNAAAIATNQTMLMISRLQEEKATIEMEALQYQRMMEEQSEYDQEALQLMNEILVKREKELQEAEKELEICRKKLAENEERERTRLMSLMKDRSCTKGRNSSASCSNGEESDGLSIEINNESREENSLCRCEDTSDDAILNLDDSISIFEEERVSILEQLKVLEEKLCALSEEEEHQNQNTEQFEQFNGDSNGIEKWKMNGQKPKQLLPLFNEAEMQSDDDELSIPKSSPTKFEVENKRLAIEEEVDHMYDRLHALEADREFIKHCIGSLSKGDRGVHLLQEILQHLRDLKNVELLSRSLC